MFRTIAGGVENRDNRYRAACALKRRNRCGAYGRRLSRRLGFHDVASQPFLAMHADVLYSVCTVRRTTPDAMLRRCSMAMMSSPHAPAVAMSASRLVFASLQ